MTGRPARAVAGPAPARRRFRRGGLFAGLVLVLTACTSTVAGVAERPAVGAAAHASASAHTGGKTTSSAATTPASGAVGPGRPTTRPTHRPTTRPSSPSSSPVPTSPSAPPRVAPAPMPTRINVTELYDALTIDLRQHDRKGFLSRFRGPAAGAAGRWWDNLAAIGFDGGAVSSYHGQEDVVRLDASGRGTIEYVTAGTHHPGDGVEPAGAQDVPTTLYRWQLAYDRRIQRVTVTGWTALSAAPWDCTCTLHIARRGAALVAATAAEGKLADSEVDDLLAALRWSATFSDSMSPDWPQLNTAVAFTTDHPDRMAAWFQVPKAEGGTGRDPYWKDPPPAYTHYLLGDTGRSKGVAHDSYIGGARIVLGPEARDGTTETLVHELVHYRMATERTDSDYALVHPWIAEGVAQLVQQIYVDTSEDQAATGDWVVGGQAAGYGITGERLAAEFRGRPPTATQVYATEPADRTFWYQISASVYDYLAQTYGLKACLEIATRAQAGRSPFGLVPDPDHPRRALPAAGVQKSWTSWVRATYG